MDASNTELTAVALRCFEAIVDALPDPLTVLELGACDGYHTGLLAAHLDGRDFRYFAFEPDPDLYPLLVDRAPGTVVTVNAAVGGRDGTATFWQASRDFYGSGSLKMPGGVLDQLPDVSFAPIEVQVVTLDTFAERNGIGRVSYVWSDIQGAERDMIEGGRETLANTGWLYTEADGNGLYDGDVDEHQICALLPDFENMGRVGDSLLLEEPVMVSALIPTITGREHWLQQLEASLDETCPDGERIIVRDFPNWGVACNAAAEQAKGDYLAFLSDDHETLPGWWEAAAGGV